MRIIVTLLKWIIGFLIGSIVVVAASIIIDRSVGVNRLDGITNTVIPNGDNPAIRAYVARPSGEGPFPVVIMVHEWWGLKSEIAGKADALAKDGYIVVAPNLFRNNTTDWIPTAIWQVSTTPSTQVDADLDAVMLWIKNQPDANSTKVAIMGFCFGGGTAIRYSVNTPGMAATAVFYGSTINDPQLLARVTGPVLGIFGAEDTMIPVSEVNAFEAGLKSAGVPNEITIYAGEGHAFVKSMEDIAKGGNQQKAWEQLRGFLKQALYGSAQQGRTIPMANRVAAPHQFHPSQLLHLWVCNRTTAQW